MVDRKRGRRLAYGGKYLPEFACRAGGRVRLPRRGIVDDLNVSEVARGGEREELQQRRRDGKVAGRNDAALLRPRRRIDPCEIVGAKTRRPDHYVQTVREGLKDMVLHHVRVGVVDQ